MTDQQITYNSNPSRPRFSPPPGAVDAHCHVVGPATKFPYAPGFEFAPADAPKEKLFALRDFLGFERTVIVQADCHGADNSALIDALIVSEGRARGVAAVESDMDTDDLRVMDEAGVRAVRFNLHKSLGDATALDPLVDIARRIEPLGWHVAVDLEASNLETLTPFLKSLPTTVVIDHLGRPDVAKGTDHPDFLRFCDFLANDRKYWTKVSGLERLSVEGPPYDDVIPFARRLVENFPDRVLWGSDWPHPDRESHIPDDGALVDVIPGFAPDIALQSAMLITNPMRLYWR